MAVSEVVHLVAWPGSYRRVVAAEGIAVAGEGTAVWADLVVRNKERTRDGTAVEVVVHSPAVGTLAVEDSYPGDILVGEDTARRVEEVLEVAVGAWWTPMELESWEGAAAAVVVVAVAVEQAAEPVAAVEVVAAESRMVVFEAVQQVSPSSPRSTVPPTGYLAWALRP